MLVLVSVLNTTDFAQAGANFVTNGTAIVNPYGIDIDEVTGDVFCAIQNASSTHSGEGILF
jgi:hypothetical protein